jgi:cation diffusion facilitator CzcD-associated flavoprotein CzcO
MEKAEWDASANLWRIETRDVRTGETRVTHATALVSAIGVLVVPKIPELQGIESFKGEVFHSARWRHDIDLHGKRVGVLGNGSSACVLLPLFKPRKMCNFSYQIPVYPNHIQRSHCPRRQFRTH